MKMCAPADGKLLSNPTPTDPLLVHMSRVFLSLNILSDVIIPCRAPRQMLVRLL